jgi:hypothetical protein
MQGIGRTAKGAAHAHETTEPETELSVFETYVSGRTVFQADHTEAASFTVYRIQDPVDSGSEALNFEDEGDETLEGAAADERNPSGKDIFRQDPALSQGAAVHLLYKVIGEPEDDIVGHKEMIVPEKNGFFKEAGEAAGSRAAWRSGLPGGFEDEYFLSFKVQGFYVFQKENGDIKGIHRVTETYDVPGSTVYILAVLFIHFENFGPVSKGGKIVPYHPGRQQGVACTAENDK